MGAVQKTVTSLVGGDNGAKKLARQQEDLAKQQSAQIAEQNKRLAQQEANAQADADAQRRRRASTSSAARRRTLGRSSLIKTSELGTSGGLG